MMVPVAASVVLPEDTLVVRMVAWGAWVMVVVSVVLVAVLVAWMVVLVVAWVAGPGSLVALLSACLALDLVVNFHPGVAEGVDRLGHSSSVGVGSGRLVEVAEANPGPASGVVGEVPAAWKVVVDPSA